jgi:glutamyl/glutaminyl-tRNA synthetase
MLAALLAWLDARSRGDEIHLRLEDLDPDRVKPEYASNLVAAFDWMGLDWDGVWRQSELHETHAAALERLAALGLLYPCSCTRKDLRERALPGTDGHLVYPGTCRDRALPSPAAGGWRATQEPLRVRLPEGRVAPVDEGGLDLSGDPAREDGDPIVRRRDGAVAYQLAGVVDDGQIGVTRVVRGRDLAPSTATQCALASLLGLEWPRYRHHLLLLEPRGSKLAKLHGSVGFDAIRPHMDGATLVGLLAHAVGISGSSAPVHPQALVQDFDWARVRLEDLAVQWDGTRGVLEFGLRAAAPPAG